MSGFNEVMPSLITATPAQGRELAIVIARKTIATMQPDSDVRQRLRPAYAENVEILIHAGQVVATEFQTIALANNFWK
ncbi:hexameric tyrosine-coordinated heme protein [Shewanella waksmanii]|uniref:hexameric tyrosine-coordinated heme protein n=1 Tax=Shewanella waksmanii TaxID=213783 RepID=UPI0037351DEF